MTIQPFGNPSNWLTDKLRKIGFSEQSQIDVQSTHIYEVHAVVVWSDIVFCQIVEDSGVVAWVPACAFKIVDSSMPQDWMANFLDEEIPFIVGPEFVVRDKESYADMVDLSPEKVTSFKQRLQSIALE